MVTKPLAMGLPALPVPDDGPFRFVAAPGALFQLDGPDRFAARVSPASPLITNLTPDHLRVYAALQRPMTLAAAQDELFPWFDPDEVQRLGDDLMAWDLVRIYGLERIITDGFGALDTHVPMVADVARVEAYARAISRHVPGKRVAELGCGTGILSLLSAKAGARSVWAVEETDIIRVADELIRTNSPTCPVELVRGTASEHAPDELVDVLVHEIFGLDPFDEGIMLALDDARDRWLKPGGRLLPNGFSVWAMALGPRAEIPSAEDRFASIEDRWRIDLGAVRAGVRAGFYAHPSPSSEPPAAERCLSHAVQILAVDLHNSYVPERCTVELPIVKNGEVAQVLMWFDIHLDERVRLSTGPFSACTHWGWQVHERMKSLPVRKGQGLHLDIDMLVEDVGQSVRIADARVR